MTKASRRTRMILGTLGFILALTGKTPAILTGFVVVIVWSLSQDKPVLRRVGRWKFWVFTISITILAGLFLGSNPKTFYGIPISIEGFYAGIIMNLRAFTLIISTVLLAKSITRNSFFKTSSRLGLPNLTPAFSSAMSTLPKVSEAWNDANKKAEGAKFLALAHLFNWITDLARGFSENGGHVFIITGKRAAGKTTLIHRLSDKLIQDGFQSCGIYQTRKVDSENATIGYTVNRLNKEDIVDIAAGKSGEGFRFFDEGFEKASDWIMEDAGSAQVIMLDEMGLLEANGKGYAPVFANLLVNEKRKVFLITLRKDKQNALSAMFDLDKNNILDLDKDQDIESFYDKIKNLAKSLS